MTLRRLGRYPVWMDGEPESDERLMQRVQAGDREAYEALYARWRERTFAFLCKRTGALAAAEDAQQEAWLRVYRFRDRYDPTRSFRAWLFTLVANAGRDATRPDPELLLLEPQHHEPGDLATIVARALAGLDSADRRLLLLAIEGFDAPEIAEMLSVSPGAVRMRLYRARARLRAAVWGEDA